MPGGYQMGTKKCDGGLILSFFFTFVFLFTFYFCLQSVENRADAAQSSADRFEEKVLCKSTIDEEFVDDCVLVVIDKYHSKINQQFQKSFFGSFPIKSITDLMKTNIKEEELALLNKEDFRQILKIELEEHSKQNVLNAIHYMEHIDGILNVSPCHILAGNSLPLCSSGLRYPNQWGIHGQYGINAESSWEITRGSDLVRVGIIDTGVYFHSDLIGNIDNYWNIITENNVLVDNVGHGTHIAGIIGATGDNVNGIVGVSPEVALVPIQVAIGLSLPNGVLSLLNEDSCISGIEWAIENDIDIINFSLGSASELFALKTAISNYMGLFVCGAGNGAIVSNAHVGIDIDNTPYYPAHYAQGESFSNRIISVGAINEYGDIADFSNYGATTVDIFAPGDDIISAVPESISSDGYAIMDGTSMAAGFVTGGAVLVWSELLKSQPNYKKEDVALKIKEVLLQNSTKDFRYNNRCLSCGRLDTYKAVKSVTNQGYLFEITNNEATIIGIDPDCCLNDIVFLPEYFTVNNEHYPVVKIGEEAFAGQMGLLKVFIPKTVRSIDSQAFKDCVNLSQINTTSTYDLTNASDCFCSYTNACFYDLCLNIDLIPNVSYTLSYYYEGLTASCSIEDVFISLGVGDNAYSNDLLIQTNYSNVSGQKKISFILSADQLSFSSKLWCRFIKTTSNQTVSLFVKKIRLEMGIKTIAIDAFRGCPNLATDGLQYTLLNDNTYMVSQGMVSDKAVHIPSVYNGKAVTKIQSGGFAGNNTVKWVFMQEGLNVIGNRAFQFCSNLETVDMAQTSIEAIEDYTFDICAGDNQNHIHNPDSLYYTSRCRLEEISFPETLLTVGEGAFIRTGIPLESSLPNSVTSIGDYAFAYSYRIGFSLPDNLETIGNYAFAYCDLISVLSYDENIALHTIGDHAFENTQLLTMKKLPNSLYQIGEDAFKNSKFHSSFTLIDNQNLRIIKKNAFDNCDLQYIMLFDDIMTIGEQAFENNDELTIYTENNTRPNGWHVDWNSANRPVFWGCTFSNDMSYIVSFLKTATNPSNLNALNGVANPERDDYTFDGWYTTSDYSGTQYTSADIASAPNGTLYAKWTKKSCVAEGTLITLADGSQVAVEDLTGSESLLVWNMLTGQFDSAPILFIDSDPLYAYEVIELTFSDGTEVKVIDEHAFFDMTIGEYVFLRDDASQYIGHYFNKKSGNTWTTVQLTNVTISTESTTAWSPVTCGHLCYYVNGMLSMPGATEGFINIFDVDTTLMKYDAMQMAADIQTYGLYTYEEFNEIIPLPEFVFDAFGGQYLKVSIGKGLITLSDIITLLERYADFFS